MEVGRGAGCGGLVKGDEWGWGRGGRSLPDAAKPPKPLARIAHSTRTEVTMLRTIFGIGAIALLGLFALKLAFGMFGVLFTIFFLLLGWAVRIAIVGAVIYLVLRLLMPDTAKKIEEKFNA